MSWKVASSAVKLPSGWKFTPGEDGFTIGGKALPVGTDATWSVKITKLPDGQTRLSFKTIGVTLHTFRMQKTQDIPILIYGAGEGGELVLRDNGNRGGGRLTRRMKRRDGIDAGAQVPGARVIQQAIDLQLLDDATGGIEEESVEQIGLWLRALAW